MASSCMKLLLVRRLARTLKPPSSSSTLRSFSICSFADHLEDSRTAYRLPFSPCSRSFCSRHSDPDAVGGPLAVDYRSLLQEEEFHKLADSTIQDLLEKLEEYGDSVDMDGFDIDYGNQVLTLKLGTLGTYVLNKQTPNRQIWLSSPVSGPARFDWDKDVEAWVYRRTKSPLQKVLESELEQLCGQPINLS